MTSPDARLKSPRIDLPPARRTVSSRGPRTSPPLPAEIEAERRQVMAALHPIVQMLGAIVGDHIEVVLHDLTRPESSIVAIANGHVSNRRVGNSILSGPSNDKGFAAAVRALSKAGEAVHSVVANYPTLSRSGQRLRSSTVILRDARGDPFASLCLNADHTVIEAAHAWLGRLLQPQDEEDPSPGQEPEMDALMKEIIADAVRRLGKPVNLLNKGEKIQAVQAMMQRGLFIVKGGVERAAKALGVTRYTIYNYQEAVRERSAEAGREAKAMSPVGRRASKRAPRG
jgi:predicted transcriptional regulator YheO